MKKTYLAIAGILLCCAALVMAMPATTEPTTDGEPPIETATTGIFCEFNCNDGTGLGLECEDPTLGECCTHAVPACAPYGGLEDGICHQGRLGLPCTPM